MTTVTTRLDPKAGYLSPAGRFCRLVPGVAKDPHWSFATFVYCGLDARPSPGTLADGFTLSSANFHLLRRLW